ncbi:hypothetical protein VNO77_02880 [Canavalia gladiata]|uniref:BTB domain-containing protein n=1 Tax=Canavalia gladiata TaxID=3824 RepID=A0AAN9N091_CANGL
MPQVYLGEQYVNNNTLSDVAFLVEGKRFYAHRICLLASSDAFRVMFDGGYREKDARPAEALRRPLNAPSHIFRFFNFDRKRPRVQFCEVASPELRGITTSVGLDSIVSSRLWSITASYCHFYLHMEVFTRVGTIFLTSCDKDVISVVVCSAHVILQAMFPNNPLEEKCITGNLQRVLESQPLTLTRGLEVSLDMKAPSQEI